MRPLPVTLTAAVVDARDPENTAPVPCRAWLFPIAWCVLVSCGEPDSKRPPPPGQTNTGLPGQAGGSAADPDDRETGSSTDACSPYEDPADACGPAQDCSFVDGTCQDAVGASGLAEPCMLLDPVRWIDTCQPALVCVYGDGDETSGRCLWPCDPGVMSCPGSARCIPREGPGPRGVCHDPCDPLLAVCPLPNDACYPLADDLGQGSAACLPAGPQFIDGPCTRPNDCSPGTTCTAARFHTSGCDGNPGCCAALCDVFAADCFGADFACLPFANPLSPNLGVCSNPDA